jgi:hypothetical protein
MSDLRQIHDPVLSSLKMEVICLLYSHTFKEFCIDVLFVKKHSKCKAIPLQAWTGPEGSRRLRLPDFKTIGT